MENLPESCNRDNTTCPKRPKRCQQNSLSLRLLSLDQAGSGHLPPFIDILWGWYHLSNCGHRKLVRNSPIKGGNVEVYDLMLLKSKQPKTLVGLFIARDAYGPRVWTEVGSAPAVGLHGAHCASCICSHCCRCCFR